jgi:hypothetical protein
VTEIRSYRSVFDLERRIYRIDTLRLNPGGVPVRGVVYCLALLAGIALAGRLPLLGVAVRALPWYLRDLVAPVAGAGLLALIRVEGRPFHLAAAALARHVVGPRWLTEGLRPCRAVRRPGGIHRPAPGHRLAHRWDPVHRWSPGELLVLPDGSDARLRRLRYTGPGAARVTTTRQVIVLDRDAELRVRALDCDAELGVRVPDGDAELRVR